MANKKASRSRAVGQEAGSGVKISNLPEASQLEDSEFFPVVQGG